MRLLSNLGELGASVGTLVAGMGCAFCFPALRESGVRVITRDPADYRWSSYRVNAIGIESELCTPYEIYCALGDDADRLAAYRALFAALISTMNRSVTSVKPRVAAKL